LNKFGSLIKLNEDKKILKNMEKLFFSDFSLVNETLSSLDPLKTQNIIESFIQNLQTLGQYTSFIEILYSKNIKLLKSNVQVSKNSPPFSMVTAQIKFLKEKKLFLKPKSIKFNQGIDPDSLISSSLKACSYGFYQR